MFFYSCKSVGESASIVIFWFDDDVAMFVDETVTVLYFHGCKAFREKPAFACIKILHGLLVVYSQHPYQAAYPEDCQQGEGNVFPRLHGFGFYEVRFHRLDAGQEEHDGVEYSKDDFAPAGIVSHIVT